MQKELDLPKFADEDEEREFWANVDLGDYMDPEDFEPVAFPNLKPTTRPVSIRFPVYVIDAVKERANEMGCPIRRSSKRRLLRRLWATVKRSDAAGADSGNRPAPERRPEIARSIPGIGRPRSQPAAYSCNFSCTHPLSNAVSGTPSRSVALCSRSS
jgi:predicted DNA binding CopG/RHH family protein